MRGARAQPGLLGELPRRSLIQILVDFHESARQRPGTQERLVAPFYQQHLQRVVPDGEDRDVHGDGEGRVGAGIVVVRDTKGHSEKIYCRVDKCKGRP